MNKKERVSVLFNPPKTISTTRQVTIIKITTNYCDPLGPFNDLPCGLCCEPIGKLRPIGIAWGTNMNSNQERGFRLCNTCYVLAMKGESV